ncbi:nickel/cobalt transporter [Rhizobium sp. RU36D]|uniref:nickel/cobalt transporter n=1 Tax=Rhizobium sp. RU36D TaxID=1907415 RepID=UPI0009D7A30D|nr:nickel/cobalt transporter [Rhizobium sp. RU36D]SMC43292.1 ABC-type nickel/cobalt efflux system, permease component RcnA [Rhizobium sp. RU36D]
MLIERRIGGLALAAAVLALSVVMGCSAAHAASPLGVGTAEPAFQASGPFAGFLAWVNQHQQEFYRALTTALKAMREDPGALGGLIGLSFAYGVFHAAGPGHGKAVISSYLLANEVELRRGIAISFISALLQGAVAIGLVGFAYLVLRGSTISLSDATGAMEIASYGLIIAFGVWLLIRKARHMMPAHVSSGGATSSLFDSPQLASIPSAPLVRQSARGLRFKAKALDHSHLGISAGGVCAECGMTHLPDPGLVRAEHFSWREAWTAVLAVGLRPCSGALLVMTFSLLNGLYLGGILSVLAMALGTAITVSVLAGVAVSAKSLALRLSGPGTTAARVTGSVIEIGGAILIIVLGAILLAAAL